MSLENHIQDRIESYLSARGLDEPLITLSENEAKRFLLDVVFAQDITIDYLDFRDTAAIYKSMIDLINARQAGEIAFSHKHLFD
ncbi:hypothetical protein KG088_18605 [Halomonas sp. TRM85114]|uniref:hypothetical protein n=1 Tax=Halomonas jincaotanensis TaxID=2810616 RepID=UPI001BD54AC6|nr:hypothetical protein [Halomonas jincaotanensis]MBS9405604.1 hypothetical protein [Halomonas jincaotanensis]